MKLITKEIEHKFETHPIYSQDGKGLDAEVIVKFFNPYGVGTWLITEAERDGDDWNMFGYCELGQDWEWGYVSFKELANLKIPPFGLGIERDMYAKGTVRKLARI